MQEAQSENRLGSDVGDEHVVEIGASVWLLGNLFCPDQPTAIAPTSSAKNNEA